MNLGLGVQVLQKIKQLLDKPISPLTQRQIQQLSEKQVVAAQQIVVIFAEKYRADLLLHLIKSRSLPRQRIQYLLNFMVGKLLKFKLQDAQKEEFKAIRREWAIDRVSKQALKSANQQLKSSLFYLLHSNVKQLSLWSEGRIIQDFIKFYFKAFLKYNIYLSPFASVMLLSIQISDQFKTQLLETGVRFQLMSRVIDFLMITQQKQLFGFQNECLKIGALLLGSSKYKLTDIIMLNQCRKVLDIYLMNKPTRQEARKMQLQWGKIHMIMQNQNRGKMQVKCDQANNNSSPLLIERVIEKTNNYRQRHHLDISQSRYLPAKSRNKSREIKYLKRGEGVGGGKSFILQPSPSKQRPQDNGNIQKLIEDCIAKPKRQKPEQLSINSKISECIYDQNMEDSRASRSSTLEQNWEFDEISNLIELAYQYKFGIE